MDGFQKTILFIAIIILIISLIIIGFALAAGKDSQWPPMVPNCPDYWIADGSGNNAKCVISNNLFLDKKMKSVKGNKYHLEQIKEILESIK